MRNPWVQRVEEIEASKEVPLFGHLPSFPWKSFSKDFGELFEIQDLQIQHSKTHFLKGEDLISSFGKHPVILSIGANLIQEKVHLVVAREDLPLLCRLFTKQETALHEGFFNYLCLEALHLLNESPYKAAWGGMALSLANQTPLPKDNSICIDLNVGVGPESLFCRLICSEAFRTTLKSVTLQNRISMHSLSLSHSLPVTLSLTIGDVVVTLSELKNLKTADFLVCDNCSYNFKKKSGKLQIDLDGEPLFHALFKSGKLEIEDYILYHEEPHMSEEESQESNPDHLWSQEESVTQTEKSIATAQIPITIQIEIGKIQMPLEELLKLKPGNTLPLSHMPENGVFLVVNGKRIGRGDLVQLGETLGVAISHIGG